MKTTCYSIFIAALLTSGVGAYGSPAPAAHKRPAAPRRLAAVRSRLVGQRVVGVVRTNEYEALPGATVFVKSTFLGTCTNSQGHFSLELDFAQGPVVLVVSFVGYQTKEVTVEGPENDISVTLDPSPNQLNDVVVAASRVEESIMRAPVTIEKVSGQQIEQITTPEVLAGLGQFKGVDVNSASMLFTSVSTRGFNTAKSERVVQLYDYADAQLPSLSLSPGNLLGIPELDMESIEVIHGPASALYGSNALNGVILFNSKDPYVYEGLSARVRGGQRDFFDGQVRYAQRLGRRWAFKVVGSYVTALDWVPNNYEANALISSNPTDSPQGFNAVNRYGDINRVYRRNQRLADGTTANAELADKIVYMPGFTEGELIATDNHTNATRGQANLSYLFTDDLKATLSVKHAEGTSTYQNQARFRMKGLGTNQYRAELTSSRGFVRAYTTEDFSGDSYELGSLASNLQNSPVEPGGTQTFADRYYSAYNAEYTRQRSRGVGAADALAAANAAATASQLDVTDPRFTLLRGQIIAEGAAQRGAKLVLNSFLNDVSAQRNFKFGPATEVVVGGAYRDYRLGSGGGYILADEPGQRLRNYEYGGYLQAAQRLFDDRLKLAAAGRLDNFKNFDLAFSPRLSAVLSLGATKQHNFRASYGRAYRAPSQIEQYSRADLGTVLGLGNIGQGFEGYSLTNAQGQSYTQVLTGVPLSSFEFSARGCGSSVSTPTRWATRALLPTTCTWT